MAPAVPEGWETVSGPYLVIHGEADSLPVLLELARHGSESLVRLSTDLGVAVGGTIHVILAPSQDLFLSLQPSPPPHWVDGTAWPERGHIFLRRPSLRAPGSRPLRTVLDHELVHILLGRAFAPRHPPQWLEEGIAQVEAGEVGPDTTTRLARGMASGGLYSLEALSMGFPEDPRGADLAYAQSADLIAWLKAEYGEDVLRVLVAEMRAGADISGAMRAATGSYIEDVDARWRARIERETPLWIAAIGSSDLLFGVAAAGAAVGLVLARARIRRRMRRMAAEEAERDALLAALWSRES